MSFDPTSPIVTMLKKNVKKKKKYPIIPRIGKNVKKPIQSFLVFDMF